MLRNRIASWAPWVLGLALSLGLAWLFLGQDRPLASTEFQDGWRFRTGKLMPEMTVGQTFKSRLDNLARIDVRLGTFGNPLVRSTTLNLVETKDLIPGPPAQAMLADEGTLLLYLNDGDQIGQTFTPRRDGLCGLRVMMETRDLPPQAEVRLRVYYSNLTDHPGRLLAEVTARRPEMQAKGFHLFSFPPLKDVQNRELLFTLDVKHIPFHHGPGGGPKALWLGFISDQGDYERRPRTYPNPPGEVWRPKTFYGWEHNIWLNSRDKWVDLKLPWDFWRGDLLFWPVYPPALPQEPVLRRVPRPGWLLSDNAYTSFSFKPVAGSQGRAYYFFLQTDSGSGRPPTVLADWAPRYPYGTLALEHVPTQGELSFRAYNQVDRGWAVRTFLDRLTRNKPGPFSRPWLAAFLAAAQVLLLAGLLGLVLSGRGRRG